MEDTPADKKETRKNFLDDYNNWFKRKTGKFLWETGEKSVDKSTKT